jgi:HEAT repeat protein
MKTVMQTLAMIAWALVVGTGSASAETAAEGVVAPAGSGQSALAARVIGNAIAYKACGQTPCTPASGDPTVPLPVGASASEVVIDLLPIGAGRHGLWAHTTSFGALLAAVPGGAQQGRVLWSGALGFSKGELGERSGEYLEVTEPEADRTVRVLLGEVREDVAICGRRSLLSPKVLDPKDLTFKGVRLQRLRRDERERATALSAVPSSAPAPGGVGRVLMGVSASSGTGTPSALTDGDLETTWSENRGGEGNGEFVQMNAPEQVEIISVSIVARPPKKAMPKGAGPRKMWLATPEALFAVTFAEDPWARPGASYEVKFPAPLRTRCLSLILEDAWVRGSTDVDVTLAEVTAHTEFDGKADPAALAGALAGGQARARMAAAILARGGDAAYDAVIQVYPTLDDQGRVLALEVIDNAGCARSAPLYLKAMEIGRSGEVHHATDRLIRCGRSAAPALSAALANGPESQKSRAVMLLALAAPDVAVNEIVALLPSAKAELRADFRAALTKTSQNAAAREVIATKLSDPSLPPVAALDLLRAATARPSAVAAAASAFARLDTQNADFRTRYLLLSPAVELAKGGDSRAEAYILRALTTETDVHIRAHAAEVAGELPKTVGALTRLLDDADPRVRDAALTSLSRIVDPRGAKVQTQAWPPGLFASVAKRLEGDPFTFVRTHAADALIGAPAGEEGDRPLAKALADASPLVRARAVETLGRRGARAHANEIRERLEDASEALDVRVRAARALGRVCDAKSVDRLTELARKASTTGVDGPSLAMSASAAAALGRLNPPDLSQRLGPLSDKRAPRIAQEIAKGAMSTTDRCR